MPAAIPSITARWPILLAAMTGGLLFAAAIGLWVYAGTTVFFEILRTGWMACF